MSLNVMVTGAGSGIGKAVAENLASQGHNLALVGRNVERLGEVKASCDTKGAGKVQCFPCDVGEFDQLQPLVQGVSGSLGGIDCLINNAGMGRKGTCGEVDIAIWQQMIQINLTGLVTLTHHALPFIKKSQNGAVINIASVAGKQGFKGSAGYSASKFGVVGFTEALFEDVREDGVKVCAICPGYVDTPMVASRNADHKKMIRPEDIAHTVDFVLGFSQYGCPVEIVVRPQQTPSL